MGNIMKMGDTKCEISIDDIIENAVMNHDRLVDEVEALREALRLKEAECEVLEGDKSELLLSLNETVCALADICGANGIKGEDDFICEIEEFIVEMVTDEKTNKLSR